MHYLHKNPSGEIKLNFDTMTDKMMRDKVQNEKSLADPVVMHIILLLV